MFGIQMADRSYRRPFSVSKLSKYIWNTDQTFMNGFNENGPRTAPCGASEFRMNHSHYSSLANFSDFVIIPGSGTPDPTKRLIHGSAWRQGGCVSAGKTQKCVKRSKKAKNCWLCWGVVGLKRPHKTRSFIGQKNGRCAYTEFMHE